MRQNSHDTAVDCFYWGLRRNLRKAGISKSTYEKHRSSLSHSWKKLQTSPRRGRGLRSRSWCLQLARRAERAQQAQCDKKVQVEKRVWWWQARQGSDNFGRRVRMHLIERTRVPVVSALRGMGPCTRRCSIRRERLVSLFNSIT